MILFSERQATANFQAELSELFVSLYNLSRVLSMFHFSAAIKSVAGGKICIDAWKPRICTVLAPFQQESQLVVYFCRAIVLHVQAVSQMTAFRLLEVSILINYEFI